MRRRTIPALVGLTTAAATGLTLAVSGAGAMEAPKAPAATKPIKVTVTATDFAFKLSKTTVPKGVPIVFTLINKGPSPHDWDLDGTKGTPIILDGKTAVFKYTFKKAGSYRYVCTVPRHSQFGMVGDLIVK